MPYPHPPPPTSSNVSTANSNHSSAAPLTQSSTPSSTHQQNRNRARTGIANIGPSVANPARLPGQTPAQTLGRRQRSPASDGPSDPQPDSSQAPDNDLTEPPTKRRRENNTMGGSDILDPHNGAPLGFSNGSTEPSVGVANGHKSAMNGSTNRDNNSTITKSHGMPSEYFGHNREEVTRLLIQALSDMGYQTAADNVSRESGYELESPTVAGFRSAVLSGSWSKAEELLTGASFETEGQGNGLVLAPSADRNAIRFWLRQQKFLELLEQKDTSRALVVLRSELTPLSHDTGKLHFLSSLLMCRSVDDLMAKADWDGANGQSRKLLLSELSKCISPSVMLPENRLAVLLEQVKQSQIDTCLYHTQALSPSLYSDHFCDRRWFPTEVALDLVDMNDEIWQVQFSHDGSKLAACGSGRQVIIWDTHTYSVAEILDDHDEGVGNMSFSPDDTMILCCARDGYARLWSTSVSNPWAVTAGYNANREIQDGRLIRQFNRFAEPVSGCVWAHDNRSLVLGTLDPTFSLRTINLQTNEEYDWGKKHRVEDLCGSLDGRWLVALDNEKRIHVYNAITRELEFDMELNKRPTSVSISQDSRHLLINKSDGEAQLIDLVTRNSVQKFFGHTGGAYMIRSAFGGANESFVVSGSEDGNILIWHKNTGAAIERLPGHHPRCNAVAWNPTDPYVIASCGDDGRLKIWTNKSHSVEIRARYLQNRANDANTWDRDER
ncbi:hypothetical protein FAUST_1315 [Fusarium austroamericanum]|uniref:CTLH domain-containing protein n=1 Tax=Fusarium austroamericanum TaxID=282268 RepID=A0AAN6HJR1_FUSAU|nr:hypothetical protein FAUST_1315 [Fusarium austroamericanum]